MAKDSKQPSSINKIVYRSEVNDAFAKETALFESFFDKISTFAKTHKQVTINNINQIESRMQQLKKQSSQLKDSILFHDEEVVVDRSKIIRNTEGSIQDLNKTILHYDRMSADEIINAIDYLSKALVTVKKDFFDYYQHAYLNDILASEEYFDFFNAKSQAFQDILNNHQESIYRIFSELDDEIKFMDENISQIISDKNRKMLEINSFYENELKHYSDNQLSYSAESDPTSIEIQALTSDKIYQFNTYKDHQFNQNTQIRDTLRQEYLALFNHIHGRLLRSKSYDLVNAYDFFDNPVAYIDSLKKSLLDLDSKNNAKTINPLIKKIKKLEYWQKNKKTLETKAHNMLSKQMRNKVRLMVFNERYSAKQIAKMELSLNQYLEVMRIDPFLAQSLGDEGSTFIKDERMYLSVLKVNKELKANINFDIQTAKIKSEINALETKLRYAIKKDLFVQEIELMNVVHEINGYLIDTSLKRGISRLNIMKERVLIERLDKAANEHLAYLLESLNTNRMWLSLTTQALIDSVRAKETHNIYVTEAKARIEYLLKQYDMKALHFKTMYENELNYLVVQKTRVDQETLIHNEFILTTYLNQMRFAQEQIKLAENEYRLRLEAITSTIDDERSYHQEIIQATKHRYDDQIKIIKNEYEAYFYQDSRLIAYDSDDKKRKSVLSKIEKETKSRDQKVNALLENLSNDEVILKAEAELSHLDDYFEESVNDATDLRNDTIAEFTELYQFAKERYEVLKPYLEASVNIMDPTFYDQLEKINNRKQFELKKAEIELDLKSKDLIQNYLQIAFQKTEEIDKAAFAELIDGIMSSREQVSLRYAGRLQAIETAYQSKTLDLAKQDEAMRSEAVLIKTNWKYKHDTAILQLKQSLNLTEQEYAAMVESDRLKTEKAVATLSSEYKLAIKSHRQFTEGVANDFDRLIKSYRPYIKLSKHEIGYAKLVRPLEKKSRIKLRKTLRDIELRYHRYKFLQSDEQNKKRFS